MSHYGTVTGVPTRHAVRRTALPKRWLQACRAGVPARASVRGACVLATDRFSLLMPETHAKSQTRTSGAGSVVATASALRPIYRGQWSGPVALQLGSGEKCGSGVLPLAPMNVTSLRYQAVGRINISFGEAQLSSGIANHRLVLPAEVTSTWLDAQDPQSNTQALLTGTVWTDQPSFRWLAGLQTQVITLRGYAATEELIVSLTDDQLVNLERTRGEDDVALWLKLQGTLLAPPADVHPVAHEEIPVRIPRARWLQLLDQVGAEVSLLVRVPSPLIDSSFAPPAASNEDAASLAQAAARLRKARTELHDQQWEHCVATCRRVLENISRLVPLPSAKSVSDVPAHLRTQDQRWAAIYHDVKSMTSAAHHDDNVTDGFRWRRVDAEAILAATAGLLGRFTQS